MTPPFRRIPRQSQNCLSPQLLTPTAGPTPLNSAIPQHMSCICPLRGAPVLIPEKRLILTQFFPALLGVALFCSSTSWAQTSPVSAPQKNGISSADRIAISLINSLPESGVKDGLKRYYQILDPRAYATDNQVASKNSGVINYFQHHFANNKCFAEKALLFYRDLRLNTRQTQLTDEDEKRHSRTSLGDKAGVNRKDLKPGWLYEKALRYTKGNSNAALTLIGMCGHDDLKQGEFLNDIVEEELLAKGYRHQELFELPDGEENQESPCPARTADFYIAGALADSADIDASLKRKILETQYPGKKEKQVASKNYHVLGAAFMTCQMIEAGLNPLLAVKVEAMAANLYRGIRLCQNIEIPANLFWRLQRDPQIKGRHPRLRFEDAVIQNALAKGRSKQCQTKSTKEDVLCDLLKSVGAPLELDVPRLEQRAQGLLQAYMDNMIASGLYASWHVSGEIAGVSLPCSREQLFGPHPFMQWLVSRTDLPLNICGSGLTAESCRKALVKIKRWEIDFDWTVSQHVAGAKFAARVCKPSPSDKTSFTAFCE